MGSGASSSQQQRPGTLSPVTASLLNLFGGNVGVKGSQYVPRSFGGEGATFTPESFSALPGLLQNIPMTGAESFLTSGAFQNAALGGIGASQDVLSQGAAALPALLETNPAASIAQARRQFSQETLPAILERAPGFSNSDLQRELTRGGVDLETNIAAMKEASLGRVGQMVQALPGYAEALGNSAVNSAAQLLGYGTSAREFMRETSPAGDAFRVLSMLQSLTGPSVTQAGKGGSKSVGVL